MKRNKGEFSPSLSDVKILVTIDELNKRDVYPLSLGVHRILIGLEEKEVLLYSDLPTFGTLKSFSSKKVSRLITMLTRYQYLEKFSYQDEDEYLRITSKGNKFLEEYFKKHKYNFVSKSTTGKPIFIKIK